MAKDGKFPIRKGDLHRTGNDVAHFHGVDNFQMVLWGSW